MILHFTCSKSVSLPRRGRSPAKAGNFFFFFSDMTSTSSKSFNIALIFEMLGKLYSKLPEGAISSYKFSFSF